MADRPSPLTTWCRLLRLPNLFTVPGDPLAGFMLATGGLLDWRVAGAMATSLLLYSAGLLLNDYFDRHVDARERPDRPIPSGAVKAGTVLVVGLIMLVAGVAIAFAVGHPGAGAVAVALALTVFAYDAWLKHVRWLGPVVMGSCRAASVVLGASFAFRPMAPQVAIAAATVWAYIVAVTVMASGEASGTPVRWKAFVPAPALALGGAFLQYSLFVVEYKAMVHCEDSGCPIEGCHEHIDPVAFVAVLVLLAAVLEAMLAAYHSFRGKLPTPAMIGRLIRILIVVQAVWCLTSIVGSRDSMAMGLIAAFVALRAAADITSRRFYGS